MEIEAIDAKLAALADTYAWLQPFTCSLDDNLAKIIANVAAEQKIEGGAAAPAKDFDDDIFQYDSLLSDASGLLDNCLSYRREWQTLAETAFVQASQYDLYQKQSPLQSFLEQAAWLQDLRVKETAGYAATAQAFGVDKTPLANGFQIAAQGAQAVSDQAATYEKQRAATVQQKWENDEAYQLTMTQLHSQPGHFLNYAERAGRVYPLLMMDFEEAVRKINSARAGIERTALSLGAVGAELPVADDFVGDAQPLDAIVRWLKKQIRAYELYAQDEIEYEMVMGNLTPAPNGGHQDPIVFNLTPELLNYPPKAVRLRGVGLSLGYTFPDDNKRHDAEIAFADSAWVLPPSQKVGLSTTKWDARPKIPLRDVAQRRAGTPPNFYRGPAIRNCNPYGQWTIQLPPWLILGDVTAGIAMDNRREVWLHLSVVGK